MKIHILTYDPACEELHLQSVEQPTTSIPAVGDPFYLADSETVFEVIYVKRVNGQRVDILIEAAGGSTPQEEAAGTPLSDDQRREIDEWFDSLSEASLDYDKQFDAKITYIGSGAIALVLAFAEKISETDVPFHGAGLLYWGCALTVGAVVLNFLSFTWAKIIVTGCMNRLGAFIRHNYEGMPADIVTRQERTTHRCIFWYNLVNSLMLCSGIALLVAFVICNIK